MVKEMIKGKLIENERVIVTCVSCSKEIGTKGVVFKCPSCLKEDIARCLSCKKISSRYKCKCGFVGP